MPKCFVIMPFSATATCSEAEWTEVFEQLIVPAVRQSKLGFECTRSQIRSGAFIKDILSDISEADVVIADLTDRNPNVFYELGVRHCLKNRTVLITQDLNHVPSDLKAYGTIRYSRTPNGIAQFKRDISRVLRDLMGGPDRADNPVADFLQGKELVLYHYDRVQSERKIAALISECSHNLGVQAELLSRVNDSLNSEPTKLMFNHILFRTDALSMLVATNYVVIDSQALEDAHTLLEGMTITNNHLDTCRRSSTVSTGMLKKIKENLIKCEELIRSLLVTAGSIARRLESDESWEPNKVKPSVIISDDKHLDLLNPAMPKNPEAS